MVIKYKAVSYCCGLPYRICFGRPWARIHGLGRGLSVHRALSAAQSTCLCTLFGHVKVHRQVITIKFLSRATIVIIAQWKRTYLMHFLTTQLTHHHSTVLGDGGPPAANSSWPVIENAHPSFSTIKHPVTLHVYKITITNSSWVLGIICYCNIVQAKNCWLLVDHHHPELFTDGA